MSAEVSEGDETSRAGPAPSLPTYKNFFLWCFPVFVLFSFFFVAGGLSPLLVCTSRFSFPWCLVCRSLTHCLAVCVFRFVLQRGSFIARLGLCAPAALPVWSSLPPPSLSLVGCSFSL